MRFFFAHAHEEHAFVREVADRVGRPLVILDEYNFESGKTFKTLMAEWLERCDAFVLFASRASLSKPNVLFEVDEAEKHHVAGRLGRVLTFVIGEDVPFDSLPKWLQPFNARKTASARDCAREILLHIRRLRENAGHSLFFGRAKELQQLEATLVPVTDDPPARAFSLYGLPGMGKRTLAVRAGRDILQFERHLVIPVSVGDGARELKAILDDEVGPSTEQPGHNSALSDEDQCVNRLDALVGLRTLPIIHDQGGLLTNEGSLVPALQQVVQRFLALPGSYLALVSRRKIAGLDEKAFPQLYVVGLLSDDSTRYLAKLASIASIATTPNKLRTLAEYVAGYPLAAQLAINLAQRQGLDMVLARKTSSLSFARLPSAASSHLILDLIISAAAR